MKYCLLISLMFLIQACQSVDTKITPSYKGDSQAATMASVYMLTLDDGGFSGVVDLLHPDYLKQIREAVELSMNKKTSGSISDKPSSGIFEEMSDAQFVKLMYRVSDKFEMMKIDKVVPISEFIDKETTYVAVKVFPLEKGIYREFVQLVPLREHEGEWYVYSQMELDGILAAFKQKK